MAYATLEQLLDYMNKKTPTSDEEVALLGYLDAATLNIDRVLNRWHAGAEYFAAAATATTRQFVARGSTSLLIDDCIDITAVESRSVGGDWEPWGAGDYLAARGGGRHVQFDALPYNVLLVNPSGSRRCFPGTQFGASYPNVRVTARWGFSASPPADIQAACIEQAARWFKRAQSAMSDTLADSETGLLMYVKALDPDIERKLSHGRYYRPALGG